MKKKSIAFFFSFLSSLFYLSGMHSGERSLSGTYFPKDIFEAIERRHKSGIAYYIGAGQKDIVRKELSISRNTTMFKSPLVEAIQQGDTEIVRLLLDVGADAKQSVKLPKDGEIDCVFMSPLAYVIQYKWGTPYAREMIDLLLKYGADINDLDDDACRSAVGLDRTSPVDYLLKKGANPFSRPTLYKDSGDYIGDKRVGLNSLELAKSPEMRKFLMDYVLKSGKLGDKEAKIVKRDFYSLAGDTSV